MTLTLDLNPEVGKAITDAATRQGRTREDIAASALQQLFSPSDDIAALLTDEAAENGDLTTTEQGFFMAAEGTRHVWDTPEEDKAWAHL